MFLILSVRDLPIIRLILPPAWISSTRVDGYKSNLLINSSVLEFFSIFLIMPLCGYILIMSPVVIWDTSASIGKAPESCAVLKKIGALLLPIIIPPVFLLGTKGISSPICQMSELIADFLELPVPTTSPT